MTQVNKVKVQVEAPSAQERLAFLDGLRGWAALMVVFSHLLIFFVGHTSTTYRGWYWAFPSDGNLAVFVFFVLSGFALSTGYIRSGNRDVLTALCLRRYLRLAIPVFCATMLGWALHAAQLFHNIEAGHAIGNQWLSRFYNFEPDFIKSVRFSLYDVFMHFDGNQSYNPILWTMSIELFGSFLVFAICSLVTHLRMRMWLIAVILLYFVLSKNIFYISFLCGIAIAICYQHRDRPLLRALDPFLPLLFLLAVYYSTTSLRGHGLPLPKVPRSDFYTILAAVALVFVAAFHAPFRRFLEKPLSRYLGSISFPIYLTHFLVICSFSSSLLLYQRLSGGGYTELDVQINVLLSLLACFALAHCFRYVENFSVLSARKFSDFMQK